MAFYPPGVLLPMDNVWNVPIPSPIFIPAFLLIAGQNLAGAEVVFGTIRSLPALVPCCLHNECKDRKV